MKLRNLLITFIFLLFTFYLISCDTTDPGEPPEVRPPGYQEDIPWPSLADSPWPMFRNDPQGTCRSNVPGPKNGMIEWIRHDFQSTTGLSIGLDNDIYAVSVYPKGIYRLNSIDGEIDWMYDSLGVVVDIHTAPVIFSDSTIITTTGSNGRLLALTPQGKLKWEFDAESAIYNRGINIDKEGNIYFIDRSQRLYSISRNGEKNWSVENELFGFYGFTSIVFSPDGSTIYFPGVGVSLVAFDIINRSIKWTFGDLKMPSFPLVDSQGNIYVLTNNSLINNLHSIYCLKEDGSVKWSFVHGNRYITESGSSLALDGDGNVYFAWDSLYIINYSGKLVNKHLIEENSVNVSILIDSYNDIYLSQHSDDGSCHLHKISSSGSILWSIKEGLDFWPGYYGVFTRNRKWIFTSYQYTENLISIY